MKLIVREYAEQFTRGENTYKSLNIGKKAQIENWFETWAPDVKYRINENLKVYIKEGLNLSKIANIIISLPSNNLNINGYLDLEGTNITSLPDDLYVNGWLDLLSTKITSLPDNLHVSGWLDIRDTNITSLPNNLHIGENLYLGNNITSLPDDLYIGEKVVSRNF